MRAYTQGSLDYLVAEWRKSDTLSYFLQWNTSGDLGLFKNENGTTTRIKLLWDFVSYNAAQAVESIESSYVENLRGGVRKNATTLQTNFGITITASVPSGTKVATIASGFRLVMPANVTSNVYSSGMNFLYIDTDGAIIYYGANPLPSGVSLWVRACYLIA